MKLTWFGTASLLLCTSTTVILFDPFVPLKGSKVPVSFKDYEGYETIFLTHGHIDHLSSVKKIAEGKRTKIYCTRTPCNTLIKKGVPKENLMQIGTGDHIRIGDIEINILPGSHIKFDKKLVLKTVFNRRMIKYLYNLPKILYEAIHCPENGETVVYYIKAEGKSILLLGSMGLNAETEYPKDVDLLILPYQGSSSLWPKARDIIERIRPKNILFDHFDDTFPPVSNRIPLKEAGGCLKKYYKEIRAVKPKIKKEISIS